MVKSYISFHHVLVPGTTCISPIPTSKHQFQHASKPVMHLSFDHDVSMPPTLLRSYPHPSDHYVKFSIHLHGGQRQDQQKALDNSSWPSADSGGTSPPALDLVVQLSLGRSKTCHFGRRPTQPPPRVLEAPIPVTPAQPCKQAVCGPAAHKTLNCVASFAVVQAETDRIIHIIVTYIFQPHSCCITSE